MTRVFTIVSRGYLAEARVLMRSVAEHWPQAARTVFVTDAAGELLETDENAFEVIDASATAIPRFRQMAFAYSAAEFCYVLKPFCAQHLLERGDTDAVVYLDADMLLLSRPEDLKKALREHSVVLTPHRLGPLPGETMHHNLVTGGTFNAGFFAVSRSEEGGRFLDWWGRQLIVPSNISLQWHNDQGWLDFVPVFFPGTLVLRHAGYNVAFWNMCERSVSRNAVLEGDRYEALGEGEVRREAAGDRGQETGDKGVGGERYEALGEGEGVGGERQGARGEGEGTGGEGEGAGGEWRVGFGGDEYPLVLYHFSLFDPHYPQAFTGTMDSGGGEPNAAMEALLQHYAQQLLAAGHTECHRIAYGFSAFADGEPVTPGHRRYFKERFFRTATPEADPFDPRSSFPGGSGLKSLRNFAHPVSHLARKIKSLGHGGAGGG